MSKFLRSISFFAFFISILALQQQVAFADKVKFQADSLLIALQTASSDSLKAAIYLQLAKESALSDPVKSFEYISKGLQLVTEKDLLLRAELQMELGKRYRLMGNYTHAISNLLEALKVFESHQQQFKAGECYNAIGVTYLDANKPEEAIRMFQKALQIYQTLNQVRQVAKAINNIGEIYRRKGDWSNAEKHYQQAYELASKENDLHLQAVLLNNFGETHYKTGKYPQALSFQHRALQLSKYLKDTEGIAYSLIAIAQIYLTLQRYDSAAYYGQQGLTLAKQNNITYLIKDGLLVMKQVNALRGKVKQAMRYADSILLLADTIYNQDKSRLILQSMYQYELGRQQSQIELLEKERIINNQKLLNAELNRIVTYIVIAACVVIVSLLVHFLWQRQLYVKELARQNATLDAKNQELKMLNQTKDKLFSIIAHDLRSPLSALKNVLDMVDFDLLSPSEFIELAADIRHHLQSLLYTLNNLLEWAYIQIKSGDQLHQESVNISEIIAETVNFYQEVARQKEIHLVTRLADSLTAKVDKNHLRFVLRNLVHNAIKFSYPGGEVLIESLPEPGNKQVKILVQDFGKGIETSVMENLFSPAVLSSTGTAGEKGTGLGLMLCKEFINKNNGEILVNSQPEKGSVFTIVLQAG
ncbi:MAG: tetratricopeptide repeat protein [Bernardetiaceae bacterium]|nr:tetratricopeptide repeat protein [Bernardetiaceae bacterium]